MVEYRVEGTVAILEVNNPPVNALSYGTRKGLDDGLKKALTDGQVQSIVLGGRGSFIGGADIREFATGDSRKPPSIRDVCDTLESSTKPVVAAIAGFALGGGLEVAISTHYRIAQEKTMFGFPEVDIGILPAASGTQRFPRLVGLKAALDLIPTGRRIGTKEALKLGVIDKVVSGNLLSEAVTFAGSVASQPLTGCVTRLRPIKDAQNAEQLKQAALKKAAAKSRGKMAPVGCINAVMASVSRDFKQGMEIEMKEAAILFASDQARALQYAFFAQRIASKWELPGGVSHKTVQARPVKTGAVIGAGTMGTGITMAMLNVGIPVVLVEQDKKFLDRGVAALHKLYQGSVSLGRMTEVQAKNCLDKLRPSLTYDDLKGVDMVIEAVYENMELKKEIFAKLDRVCDSQTLLCSNTSTLSIDEIASATRSPERVIGTHFFVPAYYMQLLENIRGAKTSPQTIAAAMKFGTQIGKVPVLVGNCPGFVGNRMGTPKGLESNFLVEEGCLPQEVDEVAEEYGFPIGPFKVADLSGLDIGWSIKKSVAKKAGVTLDTTSNFFLGSRTSNLAIILAQQGRLGRKTGQGFYKYSEPGSKEALPDPVVNDIIAKYSADHGITRRKIPKQEILERLLYSLINEGFKTLEEGIAAKPEDIDTIWLLGFGWPRHTGGPMYYANSVGLKTVLDRIRFYNKQFPHSPHWQPSRLLTRLATDNVPMNRWTTVKTSQL